MDGYRGYSGQTECPPDHDWHDAHPVGELPPKVGQDERRMQVRAYNLWASMLREQPVPAVAGLAPERLGDFAPYSFLLDFSGGPVNPALRHLGSALADECDADSQIGSLAQVPSGSLLGRITDRYQQILVSPAPLRFEAEFVNQRGARLLYRGILLPFASESGAADQIYGVINWKELADAPMTDALLREIGGVLDAAPPQRRRAPLSEWADGPGSQLALPEEGRAVAAAPQNHAG